MLHAIRSKQFVTTFRTVKLSEQLTQELEEAKQVCDTHTHTQAHIHTHTLTWSQMAS